MRAVTYSRISTDLQSETSINEQTRRARQYAEMKGWDVVDSFEDSGFSGMNTNRPAFQELMERRGEWDVVIALKLDRFHRNSSNAQLWARNLNTIGKNFVAMDIDVDTTSAMGMAVFKIITALNEMEVEVTRERTKIGLDGVKNEGRWVGKPPLGYDSVYKITENDKDKGILQVNPEEAEVVRSIFEQHLNEQPLSKIAEYLIENNIPTKSGKRIWSSASIKGVISNKEFYLGNFTDLDGAAKTYSWEAIL